jgi:DNA-binding NtrC family response regulator
MAHLLIVDDDSSTLGSLARAFRLAGHEATVCDNANRALELVKSQPFDMMLSDVVMPGKDGIALLEELRNLGITLPVVMISGQATIDMAVRSTRLGAADFLEKPLSTDKLLLTVDNVLKLKRLEAENRDLRQRVGKHEIVHSGEAMRRVMAQVDRVAASEARVCILGETGTGKELIARMLWRNSLRADKPLNVVDCGSVTSSLRESDLFGAMRGAYTGADRDRVGLLEAAHRGTVFLDEIGDIDANFQLALLRFLESREIRPVGASRAKEIDVRVIAATNKDLQRLVEEGKFREDLWYRLNTVRIALPPLRERRSDIPLLTRFFLEKYNGRYNRAVKLMESGVKALQEYTWPGNVRQLQHLIERLTILADRVDGETVHHALTALESREKSVETLADAEEEQIRRVLAATGGNKSKAAQLLGIERKTLYRKLERMKL